MDLYIIVKNCFMFSVCQLSYDRDLNDTRVAQPGATQASLVLPKIPSERTRELV